MQRKTFRNMQCPIARGLERVGEWWSMLLMREAFYGTRRFDDFQKNLDIAPNMLTRRLTALVEEGLLARCQYSEKPPRYEYVLTPVGRDFLPVLLAMLTWGNKHFAPEGASVEVVDKATGKVAEPVLVDAGTGERLDFARYTLAPGPAAAEGTRRRLAAAQGFLSGAGPAPDDVAGQA
ncbi:winged helix-turn-helix transcriptional regulator [Cupriavidus basilensis]|uniref:winged helix-turn-helix transcriptional regulator n=2 Tax=Cupriavidus TaxID=106589 RepID=UPI000750AF0D|nr:helix-turn-helix domain-containing protein [Cupriavidus basilensis]